MKNRNFQGNILFGIKYCDFQHNYVTLIRKIVIFKKIHYF